MDPSQGPSQLESRRERSEVLGVSVERIHTPASFSQTVAKPESTGFQRRGLLSGRGPRTRVSSSVTNLESLPAEGSPLMKNPPASPMDGKAQEMSQNFDIYVQSKLGRRGQGEDAAGKAVKKLDLSTRSMNNQEEEKGYMANIYNKAESEYKNEDQERSRTSTQTQGSASRLESMGRSTDNQSVYQTQKEAAEAVLKAKTLKPYDRISGGRNSNSSSQIHQDDSEHGATSKVRKKGGYDATAEYDMGYLSQRDVRASGNSSRDIGSRLKMSEVSKSIEQEKWRKAQGKGQAGEPQSERYASGSLKGLQESQGGSAGSGKDQSLLYSEQSSEGRSPNSLRPYDDLSFNKHGSKEQYSLATVSVRNSKGLRTETVECKTPNAKSNETETEWRKKKNGCYISMIISKLKEARGVLNESQTKKESKQKTGATATETDRLTSSKRQKENAKLFGRDNRNQVFQSISNLHPEGEKSRKEMKYDLFSSSNKTKNGKSSKRPSVKKVDHDTEEIFPSHLALSGDIYLCDKPIHLGAVSRRPPGEIIEKAKQVLEQREELKGVRYEEDGFYSLWILYQESSFIIRVEMLDDCPGLYTFNTYPEIVYDRAIYKYFCSILFKYVEL